MRQLIGVREQNIKALVYAPFLTLRSWAYEQLPGGRTPVSHVFHTLSGHISPGRRAEPPPKGTRMLVVWVLTWSPQSHQRVGRANDETHSQGNLNIFSSATCRFKAVIIWSVWQEGSPPPHYNYRKYVFTSIIINSEIFVKVCIVLWGIAWH